MRGGEIAYGSRVPWEESFPFYLQRNMRQGWRKLYLDGASVINLATPVDGAGSYVTAWRKEGGVWKISAYMWNLPEAPPRTDSTSVGR